MKPKHVLILMGLIAVAAFTAGRWSADGGADIKGELPVSANVPSSFRVSDRPAARPPRESRVPAGRFTTTREEARRMSPTERLNRIANATSVRDGVRQAELLCQLLGELSKDEMAEAMRILGSAQDRGNPISQSVWDALWVQWGRVDPEGALADFAGYPNKPRSDARNMMSGWFQTDPAGALAWAREPKTTWLESVAAASAIVDSVNGEPGALQEAMLDLPPDSPVLKECVNDYFDLVAIERTETSPAVIYNELPSTLRQAAWTVTLDRLQVGDPQEAAAWLEAHAGDPGRDYGFTVRLVDSLAVRDPEGTAKWASRLPYDDDPLTQNHHPAVVAVYRWLNQDAAAASEWLASQPPGSPWAKPRPRGNLIGHE